MGTPDLSKKNPDWLRFEQEVAKLFDLFGYDEVIHDTKIDGGQCDVFARSRKRSKANIVAECKYHENPSSKVNITEVQNFIHKVSNYRNRGKIDQGYLVTNTGFTADARSAINDYVGNYVFLLTYDELVQSLLDIDHYLKEFINEYDSKGEGGKYIELKLINTTALDRTLLDSLPGEVIKIKETNQSYLVIPESYIGSKQESLVFLDYETDPFNPIVNPILFSSEFKKYSIENRNAIRDFTLKLAEYFIIAINEVAADINDKLLKDVIKALPKNILGTLRWSADTVANELINKFEELGGNSSNKKYDKTAFLNRIKQDILQRYRAKIRSVSLQEIKAPLPIIATFGSHILEAFNISRIKLDNALKQLEKTHAKAPQLKLLSEGDALPALERFITSDSASTLVLIGDYGAGKTTILRRLMRKLAEEKLAKQYDPACRIPLFISLKDYNKVPDIRNLVHSFLQNIVEVDSVSMRTFKKFNDDGRFVLLLDAFDEMLTRVTRADRRRCFKEIAELVSKNSKIILTGRPAYFNDYKELKETLNILRQKFVKDEKEDSTDYEVMCLQLLDEEQVERLIEKTSPIDANNVLRALINKPNLMDLARRPVLTSMIAQTGKELIKLENKKVTARSIYEIYTDRWVQREEDKGEFRLLIHPDQKSTFLRYLAVQMYFSGSLRIHYTELDKSVAHYFKLDTIVEIDHFSHDIRACSFLSRTDDGYYFFIHKSFMEYFVACEFDRREQSPFADKFQEELPIEIIDLLDFDQLPDVIKKIWLNRDNVERCVNALKIEKNKIVKAQKFEQAHLLRDVEKVCMSLLDQCNLPTLFVMRPESAQEKIIVQFEKGMHKIFANNNKEEGELVKKIINTYLSDFNFNL